MKTGILSALIILFFCLPGGLNAFGLSDPAQGNNFNSSDESKVWAKDRSGRTSISLLGGGSYWGELDSVESSHSNLLPYGNIWHQWGFDLEASMHHSFLLFMGNELRLGGAIGFFDFSSDDVSYYETSPETIELEVVSTVGIRAYYFTPSIRYSFGKKPEKFSPQLYIGGGVGPYLARIGVSPRTLWGKAENYFSKWALGGHISGGINTLLYESSYAFSLLVGGKIHFVRFGDFDSFSTGEKWLSGPVFTIQVGLCFDLNLE